MYGTLTDDKAQLVGQDEQLRAAGAASSSSSSASASAENVQAERGAKRGAKTKIYSHCHVQSAESPGADVRSGVDKSARRRLIAASVICLVFMIGEVAGGILSNSLAIATDAAHLLTDFASFMISLFAIWLSSRPATRKMSFGWYRAEVIGALLSVLMIWLVTGLLVYLAIERLRTQQFEIDSLVMVITASAGLLVNIIMAIALNVDGHGHGHFHSHGGGGHDHGHGHAHDHHSHLAHLHDDDDDEEFADSDEEDASAHENSNGQVENKQQLLYHHVSIDCSTIKTTLTSKSLESGHNPSPAHLQRSLNGGAIDTTTKNQSPGDIKKNKAKRAKRDKCHGGGHEGAGRGKSNINVRAAFIHVIGDFLQSLGVLIAALVIHFEPSYAIVDPICTFLFSIIVLITTINIIKDAVNVLMEGIPSGINFIEVREKLQSEPYVIRVHNLRIWSLSLDKIAISTHLVIDTKRITSAQALGRAISLLKSSYNFFEVTIQIEEYREDMRDCEHCQDDFGQSATVPALEGGADRPINRTTADNQ